MRYSYFNEFARAANKAQSYGGNNSWDGYTNMVDLGDLVQQSGTSLLPDYGGTLLNALNTAVIYQVAGPLRSRATGLACYYSYDGDYDTFKSFATLRSESPYRWYFQYALTGDLSSEGQQYVRNLALTYGDNKDIQAKKIVTLTEKDLEGYPLTRTEEGIVVLELGPEVADRLAGVYCYVAYYDEEYDFSVLLGRDNDIDADWEKGIFMDNFRGVWGSIDDTLCYMELVDVADEYQIYTVPVLLNGEEYTLSVSYYYATEEYAIQGARKGIDDNGIPDRNLLKLQPGDVIEPMHYVMFENEDDFSLMAVESLVVTAETSFIEADLGDGMFFFMFEMVDVQGNSFLSDVAIFEVIGGEIYLWEDD